MRFSLLAVAVLCLSCATLKPVPQQTLNCIEAAAPNIATQAALCVAKGGGTAQLESCLLSTGEGQGLSVLECEALAIWSDVSHAQSVAVASSTPVATVQANAQSYLIAKGVIVAATHP
jgi:hypothetical protein